MRVLITTDWYEPVINGVVTSVMNLSRQLRERGHEVKNSYIIKNISFLYRRRCGLCRINWTWMHLSAGKIKNSKGSR